MAEPAPPKAWTSGAVTILRVRGIPIRVHWLLLASLPFFAWIMAQGDFTPANKPVTSQGLFWGFLLAVVLFVSVTLHELAHSLVALRFGMKVRSITLLPIGGVSQMESPMRDPRREFLVSAAGPLTNVVLAVPLLVADLLMTGRGSLHTFVRWSWITNLTLGAFNLLLPAFPMDGGRVLRALLARRMGYARATRTAATVGRTLAILMGLLGALTLPAGLWLMLIALFIYAGAGEEASAAGVWEALGDLRVSALMTAAPMVIPESESLDHVLEHMLAGRHTGLPVVDAGGRPVGFVGLSELARIAAPDRPKTVARAAMGPAHPVVSPHVLA
ncbi:MAG: site-2 protease family protein, partial [Thermoplasmatota archaeon]